MSAPVVVVGAGFGGLSVAMHLRGDGHEVIVFEAAEAAGGRAGVRTTHGYRFDTGPTVLTMPSLLERAFAAIDADLDDFVELVRLDPAYTAHFADGSRLAISPDRDATRSAVERLAGPADAEGFDRFLDWVTKLYEIEFDRFIDRDLASIAGLAGSPASLIALARNHGFASWYRTLERFFADDRCRRIFSFQAMYAGLSPVDALGLMAVIAHMDVVQGVYGVRGGVAALADAMVTASQKAGVTFAFGTSVIGVHTRGRTRPVVELADGEKVECSAVVVNADLPIAYDELFEVGRRRRVVRPQYSPSCVVWHVPTTGPVPAWVSHHNVHFGTAWEEAFDDLDAGRTMGGPSRFVTFASLSDPTAAPDGCHGLFVLEPVPNLDADLDWNTATPALTERMLGWLESVGYPPAATDLVQTVDPPQWRRRGADRGTPFSLAHTFAQSGPFRPGPTDRRLPGVYFVGAGTRPGVGIPMVVISGQIAAQRIRSTS